MPTPIITNTPNIYELANGDVVVSLFDGLVQGTQLAVKIKKGSTTISTLRQYPNQAGFYHFNINKILQSQLGLQVNPEGDPSRPIYDANGRTSNGNAGNGPTPTSVDYLIEYGYIDTAGEFVSTATLADTFVAINGNKKYYQTDWDISNAPGRYIPLMGNNPGVLANQVLERQLALTNRNNYPTRTIADITDGVPSGAILQTAVVHDIYINEGDYYSLGFVNGWTGTPFTGYNGIRQFDCWGFNGNTQLFHQELENITSNGGGPDSTVYQNNQPEEDYRILNFKCGYNNANVSGATGLTHFYVAACCYLNNTAGGPGTCIEVSDWYRFNILPCEGKDYPIIDVAWINDFGQYDYFSFQKRNVETNSIERNEFTAVPSTWSGVTVDVDTWDRGKGTFATQVEENYTANTRYLNEYDNEYLKHLYRSPSVMVRFEGDTTWTPVVLTSNSWDEKTPQNQGKRLFQHEISFKTAWNPQIQNG